MLGNTEIRQFRNAIMNAYNECLLPIEVKRMIAEVTFLQLCEQSDKAIYEENHLPENTIYGEEQENGDILIKEDNKDAESI